MTGKDPAQTNRDLATCQAYGNSLMFAAGNPIAMCMIGVYADGRVLATNRDAA